MSGYLRSKITVIGQRSSLPVRRDSVLRKTVDNKTPLLENVCKFLFYDFKYVRLRNFSMKMGSVFYFITLVENFLFLFLNMYLNFHS